MGHLGTATEVAARKKQVQLLKLMFNNDCTSNFDSWKFNAHWIVILVPK